MKLTTLIKESLIINGNPVIMMAGLNEPATSSCNGFWANETRSVRHRLKRVAAAATRVARWI